MRFEQVKKGRKDNKVQKLIEQFLATNFDKVEVINEDDYESNTQMAAAIRATIKNSYDGKVQITRSQGRVFLTKVAS